MEKKKMTTKTQLKIKLYGGLRQYADSTSVIVDVSLPQKSDDIKNLLLNTLKTGADELVQHCALATEDNILGSDDMIVQGQVISALPPVCGG